MCCRPTCGERAESAVPTLSTGQARGLLFLLEQAEGVGIERETLLAAGDVTEDQISDPDARVRTGRLVAIWRKLVELCPEPDLGLRVGYAMHSRHLGLVGYLMLQSVDLAAGYRRLVRLRQILGERARASLHIGRGSGELSWEPDPRFLEFPQASDWILMALLNVARELTGRKLIPLEIHFPYPRPAGGPSSLLPEKSRKRWGQPRPALVYSESDLALPAVAADSELGTYLERYAELVLDALPSRRSYSGQTRDVIWRQLRAGEPTLENVARELKVGPRTLQRRLCEEGSSFSELLDELRRNLASSLLRKPDLGIHEVAFLLGYSEPSAFYRAFRRWQDTSPSDFRGSEASAS